MAVKYIRIDHDDDLLFLQGLFSRGRAKLKAKTSQLADQGENILRIDEALSAPLSPKEVAEDAAKALAEAPPPPKKGAKKPSTPVATYDLCKDHATYGARKRPTRDCEGCWAAYKQMNPLLYDVKRREYEHQKRMKEEKTK
jgi:hypothetical protein